MGDAPELPKRSFFSPKNVPQAPEDPLYSIVTAYEADTSPDKVDLGVGAYRDDDAKPWILPVVKKAIKTINDDPTVNHEYIPIAGLSEFNSAAQKLILGADSPAIKEGRVCSFQTLSGTGAVYLGGVFLSTFLQHPPPSIYISCPSWPIHRQCFTTAGLQVEEYPYFLETTKMFDYHGMMAAIQSAPRGSILLLQPCAHNPTGVDPTEDQWRQIADVVHKKQLFPFFDCAYQGFATGDLSRDNFAIRHFVEQGFEMMIAQSFAKNMGLYGQRVGAFHYVAGPGADARETVEHVASQLSLLQRAFISSPPIYGAKIASIILNDKQLFKEWQDDLKTMSSRIIAMRRSLKEELVRMGTPGNWEHITSQIGMFSFTGLTESQVAQLREEWHVYMSKNGRISVAGLNSKNVEYFARAIDHVVRTIA